MAKQSLYALLGVDSNAAVGEIETAYAARVAWLKQGELSGEQRNQLQFLAHAREVLTDAEKRARYDQEINQAILLATAGADLLPRREPRRSRRGLWLMGGIAAVALIFSLWLPATLRQIGAPRPAMDGVRGVVIPLPALPPPAEIAAPAQLAPPQESAPTALPEVAQPGEACANCRGPNYVSFKSFSVWRNADSHFYVDGTINGNPVHFLVDTGATFTSVPLAAATQLGVRSGTLVAANTGNGLTRAVRNDTQRLTIEEIDQGTPAVWYMPNLTMSIVGQNVLKNFNIEVEGDKMTFRSHLP